MWTCVPRSARVQRSPENAPRKLSKLFRTDASTRERTERLFWILCVFRVLKSAVFRCKSERKTTTSKTTMVTLRWVRLLLDYAWRHSMTAPSVERRKVLAPSIDWNEDNLCYRLNFFILCNFTFSVVRLLQSFDTRLTNFRIIFRTKGAKTCRLCITPWFWSRIFTVAYGAQAPWIGLILL